MAFSLWRSNEAKHKNTAPPEAAESPAGGTASYDEDDKRLSLPLSPDEAQSIHFAALKQGLSLAEYMRRRLLPPPAEMPPEFSDNMKTFLKFLAFRIERLHFAVFYIAETQARTKRLVSLEEVGRIHQHAIETALDKMAQLDLEIENTMAGISSVAAYRERERAEQS